MHNSLRISGLTGVLALVIVAPILLNTYYLTLLNVSCIYAILVVGYNFTLGYTGQLSLAQVGFWAIGAYTSGRLMTEYSSITPIEAMAAGVVLSAVIALVLGLTTARLRTHYLALATLGFAEIVEIVLQNWGTVSGGVNGISGIPPLSIAGLTASSPLAEYGTILFVLLAVSTVSWNIQRGRIGRRFRAVKDDELMASTLGINVGRVRLSAFVISAIVASIAGALYASVFGFLSADVFSFSTMVTVLLMLVIGGLGTVTGAIVGALLLSFLPQILQGVSSSEYILGYGVVVLLVIGWMPEGISGGLKRIVLSLSNWQSRNGILKTRRAMLGEKSKDER